MNRSKPLHSSQEITAKISNLPDFLQYCRQKSYDAYLFHFPAGGIESLSVQEPDGKCYIAIDPNKMYTSAMRLSAALHEVGHCDGGAFYNRYAACDIRAKHENTADRIAIQLRLSPEDLDEAVAAGFDDIHSLADHFGVTEDLMRKAVCLYTYGNLDCKDYLPI